MVVPNPYSPPTNILGKLTNHAKQGERASMRWKVASSLLFYDVDEKAAGRVDYNEYASIECLSLRRAAKQLQM